MVSPKLPEILLIALGPYYHTETWPLGAWGLKMGKLVLLPEEEEEERRGRRGREKRKEEEEEAVRTAAHVHTAKLLEYSSPFPHPCLGVFSWDRGR